MPGTILVTGSIAGNSRDKVLISHSHDIGEHRQ